MSYSTPDEVEAAISGMNGFFIGLKRLKVVRKRGQQTDRYPDGGNRSSARASDSGYAGNNGACGMTRTESVDSGQGEIHPLNNDDGNSEVGDNRALPGAGFHGNLDFFSPEGLLGQSMTRQVCRGARAPPTARAKLWR